MYQTFHIREKLSLFFRIFVPILIYQFANFSASFVDTTMTGHYNTLHLAGVTLATSFWSPFFTFLVGIVSALVPIVGQLLGKGEKQQIATVFYQFIYLALGLSLFLFALVFGLAPLVLDQLGLEKPVLDVAIHYLWFLSFGIVPLLLFSVLRSLFDALGLTRLSMYLMLLLLPLNAGFNLSLIYGKFGFPEMGGIGAGLGTSLAYWVLFVLGLMVARFHPQLASYKLWNPRPLKLPLLLEGVKLGVPIGGTIFAEVAVFSAVGLRMSKFSSLVIASHQSANNFSTLMYAFPLSISIAMSILVSYEVGAKRLNDAKVYGRLGRLVAFCLSLLTLTFLYLFREQVAGMYGRDQAFLSLTSSFLTYSLFFQMADTFSAPLQGILRGYKDTKVPFYLGLLSYWGLALPIGISLDHWTSFGPYSYWIGLIIGLLASGLCFQLRYLYIYRQKNSKIEA